MIHEKKYPCSKDKLKLVYQRMSLILGEGNNVCECMCVLHKKQAYLEKILEKLQHNFCLVFSWVIYEFLIHFHLDMLNFLQLPCIGFKIFL